MQSAKNYGLAGLITLQAHNHRAETIYGSKRNSRLKYKETNQNPDLFDSPCKEVTHQSGYLRVMAFESKVTAGYKMYLSIWQVAPESIGSSWNERRIFLSPYGQQRWLIGTEILLKLRVEGNVRAIVEYKVVLHLGAARLADIIVIACKVNTFFIVNTQKIPKKRVPLHSNFKNNQY